MNYNVLDFILDKRNVFNSTSSTSTSVVRLFLFQQFLLRRYDDIICNGVLHQILFDGVKSRETNQNVKSVSSSSLRETDVKIPVANRSIRVRILMLLSVQTKKI